MTPTEHKQILVAQAALHRQGMSQASHALAEGAHPGALAKSIGGLALTGLALMRNKQGGSVSGGLSGLLPFIFPLALRGWSLLGRAKPSKSLTRKLLIVGVLGTVAAYVAKRKRT